MWLAKMIALLLLDFKGDIFFAVQTYVYIIYFMYVLFVLNT